MEYRENRTWRPNMNILVFDRPGAQSKRSKVQPEITAYSVAWWASWQNKGRF
jgi:hypothetical protein